MLSLGTSLGISADQKRSVYIEPPPPTDTSFNVSWVQAEGGVPQISSEYLTLPFCAGTQWNVTITMLNFTTALWGSHGLSLVGSVLNNPPFWFNEYSSDFYYISAADPSVLFFGLNDPGMVPVQIGTATVNIYEDTTFNLVGTLPNAGDTAAFNISFQAV